MKSWFSNNWFKLAGASFLFVAIGNHPYAYYQVTRWVVFASAGYIAYKYFEVERKFLPWVFVVIVILFNPIVPFYLDKSTWQFLDFIAAVLFASSLFFSVKKKYKSQMESDAPESEIDKETIRIRKTVPVEDMSVDMLADATCTMPLYYEIKKSDLKQFLKEHTELIDRNRDIDLSPYL